MAKIENWLDWSKTYLELMRQLPNGETVVARRGALVSYLKGIDFRFIREAKQIVPSLKSQGLNVTVAQLNRDRSLIQWVDDFIFLGESERREMLRSVRKGKLKALGLVCDESTWLAIVAEIEAAIQQAKQKPVAAVESIPPPERKDLAESASLVTAPSAEAELIKQHPAIFQRLKLVEEENRRLTRQMKLLEVHATQGEISREIGLLNREIQQGQQRSEQIRVECQQRINSVTTPLRTEINELKRQLSRLESVRYIAGIVEQLWMMLYDLTPKSKHMEDWRTTAIELVEHLLDIDTTCPVELAPGEPEEDGMECETEIGVWYPRTFIAYTGFKTRFQIKFRTQRNSLNPIQESLLVEALNLFGSAPRSARLQTKAVDGRLRFPENAKVTWFDGKIGLVWQMHRREKKFTFYGILFP